jgi:hypothetical protein
MLLETIYEKQIELLFLTKRDITCYTKHHQDAKAPQLGGYLDSKASQKLALTPRC